MNKRQEKRKRREDNDLLKRLEAEYARVVIMANILKSKIENMKHSQRLAKVTDIIKSDHKSAYIIEKDFLKFVQTQGDELKRHDIVLIDSNLRFQWEMEHRHGIDVNDWESYEIESLFEQNGLFFQDFKENLEELDIDITNELEQSYGDGVQENSSDTGKRIITLLSNSNIGLLIHKSRWSTICSKLKKLEIVAADFYRNNDEQAPNKRRKTVTDKT